MQRTSGLGPLRDPTLGHGDQPLDEGPELLRLCNRGVDPLVANERLGLVPKQRYAVLGDAAQFPMCNSMTHGSLVGLSRAGRLVEPHAKTQPHGHQDLFDLAE